jgi:exonuclease SbcD
MPVSLRGRRRVRDFCRWQKLAHALEALFFARKNTLMRVLHTADWHLGQRFIHHDRTQEQALALDWLLDTLQTESVDVLIVAGDIFDVSNPPNSARELYYNFLSKLLRTGCRQVVIVGGNHDSPGMLAADRELLKNLHIHVVGAMPADRCEALLVLRDAQDVPVMIVAAVPFLRDRELMYVVAGENAEQRSQRLRAAVRDVYAELARQVEALGLARVPVIATGHLYASGALSADKQDNIYIGNCENIDAQEFPSLFDYIALGHIHRAQAVGGRETVRYAGSMIPLSFSETQDNKSVSLIDFDGQQPPRIRSLPVPLFRRLKTVQGDWASIKPKIQAFAERRDELLSPWLEIIVETDRPIPGIQQELEELCATLAVEVLKIRILQTQATAIDWAAEALPQLHELTAREVFLKKCDPLATLPQEERQLLLDTFMELQEWVLAGGDKD